LKLFIAVELVKDRDSREPATAFTADVRWVKFWNHPNMQPLFELYVEAGVAPWIPIMNAAIAEREGNSS